LWRGRGKRGCFIGDRRRGLGGGCAPLSVALSSIGAEGIGFMGGQRRRHRGDGGDSIGVREKERVSGQRLRAWLLHAVCCALCELHGCGVNVANSRVAVDFLLVFILQWFLSSQNIPGGDLSKSLLYIEWDEREENKMRKKSIPNRELGILQ